MKNPLRDWSKFTGYPRQFLGKCYLEKKTLSPLFRSLRPCQETQPRYHKFWPTLEYTSLSPHWSLSLWLNTLSILSNCSKYLRAFLMLMRVTAGGISVSDITTMAYVFDVNESMNAENVLLRTWKVNYKPFNLSKQIGGWLLRDLFLWNGTLGLLSSQREGKSPYLNKRYFSHLLRQKHTG